MLGAFNQDKALVGAFSIIVETLPMVRLQLYTINTPPTHCNEMQDIQVRENIWLDWLTEYGVYFSRYKYIVLMFLHLMSRLTELDLPLPTVLAASQE